MRDSTRTASAVLALWLGVMLTVAPSPAAAQAIETADAAEPAPDAATQMADWVIASGDNRGLPFVIIDKVAAKVLVFGADGRLRGATPALLGLGRGDDSVPGIGERQMSTIRPDERTTPAGRFMAGFGPAKGKRNVLWVDYATAISLHPVVTTNRKEQRLKRLQSPSAEDNRITYGCINVPTAFYEKVVRRTLRGKNGVVYILPETKVLDELFPAFRVQARASVAPIGDPEGGVDLGTVQEAREADNSQAPRAARSGGSPKLRTVVAETRRQSVGR